MDLLDGMYLFTDDDLFVIICQGDWATDPMRLGIGDSPLSAYEDLSKTGVQGDDLQAVLRDAIAAGDLSKEGLQPADFSLEACHGIDFFEDPEQAHPIIGEVCLRSFVPDYEGAKQQNLWLCARCAREFDYVMKTKALGEEA